MLSLLKDLYYFFLTRDPLDTRLPEDVRAGALDLPDEPLRGALLTLGAEPREGDREPELETLALPELLLPEELRLEVLRIFRLEELPRDDELAREGARVWADVPLARVAVEPEREGYEPMRLPVVRTPAEDEVALLPLLPTFRLDGEVAVDCLPPSWCFETVVLASPYSG